MDEWEWVFFYNEEHNNVESVTTFHQLDCDMGSLAEAHPGVIYFYARFAPLLEWDFNEVAYAPADPDRPPPFEMGPKYELMYVSLDAEANAFGETIHLLEPTIELSEEEVQICHKLTDAGLTYEQAEDWLRDTIRERQGGR